MIWRYIDSCSNRISRIAFLIWAAFLKIRAVCGFSALFFHIPFQNRCLLVRTQRRLPNAFSWDHRLLWPLNLLVLLYFRYAWDQFFCQSIVWNIKILIAIIAESQFFKHKAALGFIKLKLDVLATVVAPDNDGNNLATLCVIRIWLPLAQSEI